MFHAGITHRSSDPIEITIYDCDEEQLAVVWANAIITKVQPVVPRELGRSFLSVGVALPGVQLTYYFGDEAIFTNEGLCRYMAEALERQGEGDFASLYRAVCKHAGVDPSPVALLEAEQRTADAAGGEEESIGGVPSSAPIF